MLIGRIRAILAPCLVLFSVLVSVCPGQRLLEAALSTCFSQHYWTLRPKAMASIPLSSTSLADIAYEQVQELQVAIVLDGTDSMGPQIQELRSALPVMHADLTNARGRVRYGMVVYRDLAAGNAEVVLDQFVSPEELEQRLAEFKTASGAPYFPEMVDEGINHALDCLHWSSDSHVTRWIVLIGDAPPYDPGFRDENTPAGRKLPTAVLVQKAQLKKVKIICLLCPSQKADPFVQMREKTRDFMQTLAVQTDGDFIDLSEPSVRSYFVDSARRPRPQLVEIGKLQVGSQARDRIGVLPFVPLSQLASVVHETDQLVDAEARSLAVEQRLQYYFTTVTRNEIRTACSRIDSLDKPEECVIALRDSVSAMRFVVAMSSADEITVYDLRHDAIRRKAIPLQGNPSGKLTAAILQALQEFEPKYAEVVAKASTESAGLDARFESGKNTVNQNVLRGMLHLERHLQRSIDDPDIFADLQKSYAQLEHDLKSPDSWVAYVRYSYCHALAATAKDEKIVEYWRNEAQLALSVAKENLDQTEDQLLRAEVLADYKLFHDRQPAEAIKQYEDIVAKYETHDVARHALWTLMALHAGAYRGIECPDLVDANKVRTCIQAILQRWPQSYEGRFLTRYLRWGSDGNRIRHIGSPSI